MESGKPSFSRSRGSRNVDSEQATTEVNGGRDRNIVRNFTFFKLGKDIDYSMSLK